MAMKQKPVWILVRVDRGIPASLIFFRKRKDAVAEERKLRRRMNSDYEEAELFRTNLQDLFAMDRLEVEDGLRFGC